VSQAIIRSRFVVGVPITVEVVGPLGGYLSSREAPDLSTSGSGASALLRLGFGGHATFASSQSA